MTYEHYPQLDALLLACPGAVRDYKAEWGWDRYLVGGKMYAALLAPGEPHAVEYRHPLLTLKADPMEADFLRRQYPDILPGFYTDKRNWVSIRLDGAVPQQEIARLCRQSYDLVFAKLTQKLQRQILAETP